MVERAIEHFGGLDILVNNAGITGRDAPIWETTDEDWGRVLGLNLTATFYCCRAAVPHMRERRSGAIVNVASISGKEGKDRKSTRLNSSHANISYAVFC